jgi:hypothetical protein
LVSTVLRPVPVYSGKRANASLTASFNNDPLQPVAALIVERYDLDTG